MSNIEYPITNVEVKTESEETPPTAGMNVQY
jgi:hypothetical protein